MKVFISWSGETSRALAQIIYQWLPSVIQAVKPYFSPDDIAKGARWSTEIAKELESSQVGLLMVTRENLEAPWLMFEAGALSKNLGQAKVSPILFELEPTDIKGPLVQFQVAKFEKAEIKRVVRMMNSELGDVALANDVLDSSFEIWWPRLEQQIRRELARVGKRERVTLRPERELLEELLALTRSLVRHAAEEQELTEVVRTLERARIFDIRERRLSGEEVKRRLNSGGDLTGANMMSIDLRNWDLSGADLRGANLVDTDLTETKLVNANLMGANLERAVLSGADLHGADISRANFWCAKMHNVRNLDSVSSMTLANFYNVEGLSTVDQQIVAEGDTVSLSDYGSFIRFYKARGMSRAEISDVFLWTAHPYFTSIVPVLQD